MTEATTDALQQMARHVATQLVVDALKQMVANVPALPVTLTLHPQTPAEQAAYGSAAGGGNKLLLGPKPGKRRGRKPGPKAKTKRAPWTPAQHAKFRATMAAKRGAPEMKRKIGRPPKVATAAEKRCTRCDHTQDEHDGAGKCLSFRCSCTGFYR